MPAVTVGQENNSDIEIRYEDHGVGPARGADPRAPAQQPSLGQEGPGPADGWPPGHHLRPARVRRQRLPGLLDDVQPVVIEGGQHAIPWTHADQVNTALLDFLRR